MAQGSEFPHKPLFASAATISAAVNNENCENRAADNLENLNLSLASSTLDAILAVQKVQPSKRLIDSPHHGESNANSNSENEEKYSHDSEHLSEDEVYAHQSTSHKRKRSRERERSIERERSRERDRHKKKKKKQKHKKRRRHNSSPDHEDDDRNLPTSVSQFHKGKVFLEEIPNLRPENAFRIDRKANKYLKIYECVSKQHFANYRLAFRGCIGNKHITADFPQSDKFQNKEKKRKQVDRYFLKQNITNIRKRGSTCQYDSGSSKLILQPEFIKITRDSEEGNTNNNNASRSYSCLDEATAYYAQGQGMPPTEPVVDEIIMDDVFEKVAKYNQRTRLEPNNVGLWLEFVKFQNVLEMEGKNFKKQTLHLYDVYRPSRAVIEKQLAILEKAIELNPSSLQLKQAQLELYQDIWDTDKVEKAWEDLLFVHSSNVDLWRIYLSRQQSHLSTFSFSRTVKKYHRCFQTLIPILEGQVKVINICDRLEEKLIGLFYQYCCFLHQTGYTERAVSSFQGMVELNLFCPPSLNLTNTKERLAKMEVFWESLAPKFGDLHAKGWSEWEANQAQDRKQNGGGFLPVSTEEEEDKIVMAALPKSTTWLKMEKVRQDTYWLPWRPDQEKGETEDNCEDLDRVVLFEDISLALFRITKSEACVQLVCLFLSFLGINSRQMENIVMGLEGLRKTELNGYLLTQLHQIQCAPGVSLGIAMGANWTPHQSLVEFVRQIILQSEKFFSSTNREVFTLLRLELELQKSDLTNIQALSPTSCKEVKKCGKNLLKEKQNRNNLVVWDAYIRVLWVVSDKIEETMSMIDVALAMFLGSHSLSDTAKATGICLLCRTYSEIMLNFEPLELVAIKGRHTAPSMEDKLQVVGCMGALVEGNKFKPGSKVDSSPLYILRIRKRISKTLEQFITALEQDVPSSHCATVNVFVQCYALFEYCVSNFHNANEVFNSVRCSVKDIIATTNDNVPSPVQIESLLKDLYISQVSFISNTMHVESIPLTYLRSVIDEALKDFPHNGHFHKALRDVESGSFIMGRLRKFYDRQLKSSPSSSTSLFAVLSELKHLETLSQWDHASTTGVSDTGFVHRLRSLFEHTLELPACAHCPLLWRLWVAFESQHGTLGQAKGVLYRALQSCPWAKCIYLCGVECLGDKELQEMMDLMMEKEIRVCMPLEEVELLLSAEKELEEEEDSVPGSEERTADDEERTVGDEERTVDDEERTVEERTVGDVERTVGDEERTVGDEKRTVDGEERTVGDEERTVDDVERTVDDEERRTVDDEERTVDEAC